MKNLSNIIIYSKHFLTGIMTFYCESLTNLNSFGELRTNVFHEFSQIGNAIVFSLFLEQALVNF